MDIQATLTALIDEIKEKEDILSIDDLTNLYDDIAPILKVEKALKKQILTRLQAGEKATNYKLVRTRGQTKITDPNTLLERLEKKTRYDLEDDVYGVVNFYDVIQPKSMSALKDYFEEDVLNDLVAGCLDKVEGENFDFVPHDDSRPEVTKITE